LTFPNDVVVDSKGRYYVVDSNNGRVTVWDINQQYSFLFGKGTGTGTLNLPHGAYIDGKDRLFMADAVDHDVKVYNVAGDRPVFLYAFGEEGTQIGQFSYPNDIVLSGDGKLYIADRGNNRIQVWSY
jgi:sugar lactone lactonase YvrE